jgi:opacity protein-like surface antigen
MGQAKQQQRTRRRGLFAMWAIFMLGAVSFSDSCLAQDWTLSSAVTQKTTYNDNLFFGRTTKVDAFGSSTTPEISLKRTSPTSTIVFNGAFEFSEYLNHSELNSQDQLLTLDAKKQINERSTFNFSGEFSRDTSLTSNQQDTEDFQDQTVRITKWDVGPSWTYLLSPLDSLTLSGFYLDVGYDTPNKTDYRNFGSSLSFSHQLNEVSKITGSMDFSRFEPDNSVNSRTNVYGGLVGYSFEPSERLSVGGAVGGSYSMVTEDDPSGSGTITDNKVGYRVKFDLKYLIGDQTTARASASHDSEPSGSGRSVTRNRVTAGLKYQLTEKTALGLNFSYSDNEDFFGSQAGTTKNDTTRSLSISPTVTWRLTEDLSLLVQYRYREKIFDTPGGDAVANSAYVSLRYALPDLDWDGM